MILICGGAMMSGSYDILRLAGLINEVSDILMEVACHRRCRGLRQGGRNRVAGSVWRQVARGCPDQSPNR